MSAERERGQPRRGRLVLPRLDPYALMDALALHAPAEGISIRTPARGGPRPGGRLEPEFELLDTGIFDEGLYWEITADYAKASPEEMLIRVEVRNAGPDTATLEVLPTLWFRNTAAGVRQLPPLPSGPRLEPAHPVPRVLSWRHWRGTRRLASNRLDRACRGPDHLSPSRPSTIVGRRAGLRRQVGGIACSPRAASSGPSSRSRSNSWPRA
jgi:hypothetical protein